MAVQVEQREQTLVITIDRPAKHNALDGDARLTISNALRSAAEDDTVRVIVITAAGDRTFCAGMDLSVDSGEADPANNPLRILGPGYPKPVIAALNGSALGNGLEIALKCDLRVAVETAEFWLPEVGLGFAATDGGVGLPKQLPMAVALELGLGAGRLSAQRGYELGLINRVVPVGTALDTALELAAAVAAGSPVAIRSTRELMYASVGLPDGDFETLMKQRQEELMAGPDAAEGMAAFNERRAPVWRS
ncbi:enoyl-CoA hydratase/isomerase family protein [Enemella sp. A6]|uniref:enoyl-CoA hydratase/isomerase family protein n=1 Tax=Enemella sp. A6 TaxID=3440152 RepID=UPI003EB85ECC